MTSPKQSLNVVMLGVAKERKESEASANTSIWLFALYLLEVQTTKPTILQIVKFSGALFGNSGIRDES